jgi:hypothetical protein
MRNKKVIVEIIIDEDNIRDLYPDFDYLYDDTDDFLNHVFDSIETDSEDTLKELGYSVKIMESSSFDHLITFSKN